MGNRADFSERMRCGQRHSHADMPNTAGGSAHLPRRALGMKTGIQMRTVATAAAIFLAAVMLLSATPA